eukprot:TRINITY_DN15991_c0_g1_i20.p1 TRINITY_DN15991_c0_g1~~TRINITY_DN15991_c0_g1_i20.p1  ORF type:complete len:211 (-),score=64.95 TRINITY_DN15991_c0_g1_i20:120-752(-)
MCIRDRLRSAGTRLKNTAQPSLRMQRVGLEKVPGNLKTLREDLKSNKGDPQKRSAIAVDYLRRYLSNSPANITEDIVDKFTEIVMKEDGTSVSKDMQALGLSLNTPLEFCSESTMKGILKSDRYSQRSALAQIYKEHKGKRKVVGNSGGSKGNAAVTNPRVKYDHTNIVQSFNNYEKVKKSNLMLEHIMARRKDNRQRFDERLNEIEADN